MKPRRTGASRARPSVPAGRKPRKKPAGGILRLSRAEIRARLKAQRERARERQARGRAVKARDAYRPRKSDRGRLVLVGVSGQRNPQGKGRKGYLVYVTRTGKKWLIKQGGRQGWQARKISDIEAPARRNLRKAGVDFQRTRRQTVQKQLPLKRGAGRVKAGKGAYDFTDAMVEKIARALKKTIEAQRSHRRFLIVGFALVELPDGTQETFQFEVPIEKADHIRIKLQGLLNFVRMKFYAFMARELQFSGYVTSGSSNHIRHLEQNRGMAEDEWLQDDGQAWRGRGLDVVRLLAIEWEIQQLK